MGAFRRSLPVLFLAGLAAFILGPLLSLILWAFAGRWFYPALLPQEFSLKWWDVVFGNRSVVSSIKYSLMTAPTVTLLSALICLPAAYAFARFQFPGRRFLLLSFLSANSFPKIGLYISIATLFYRLHLMTTFWGVVLIQLMGTLLFMIWIPTGTFRGINRSLEEAARDVGASSARTFFQITLPIAMPGLLVAGLFAFLAAFDEAQGTLIVGSPNYITMPVMMYTLVLNYPQPVGAVFSILLTVPSLVLLLLAQRLLRQGYLAAGYTL
ncbi:MAG: ABC transporter permease subunit [Bacillati bacterium ANGP1]|uniref:ABC transporter permease subunit n=1 Tax=Candidatus Segetimicrobium genomatis TaxID=2569760 RepID=A0A537LVT1_9BACT|nr:MAG: ABC transporter permease subunit [Terrabacteria group bacterium ANGP1]TMJ12106.1 MAG: ABC transporter permease subunit [Terrabacteria group bacterium ANGP1]